MRLPIGIDLGTTYSAIAKWKNSFAFTGPETYNWPAENQNWGASKIYIQNLNNQEENIVIGKHSIKKSFTDPDHFFSAFKRGMDDNTPIVCEEGEITPVELSALLLRYMLDQIAKPVQGADFIPDGVVVSVPYYFTEPPCQNTRKALGGALDKMYAENPSYNPEKVNLKTVAEPIAAGLDYAFTHSFEIHGKQTILVFDLGGGTFDVTLYELENDEQARRLKFTVLGTDGDARLGGEDFDASIREYILSKNGITQDIAGSPNYKTYVSGLAAKITEAKETLSFIDDVSIVMNPFFNQPMIDFKLTRKDVAQIMSGEKGSNIDYLSKIDDIVDRCIIKSGVTTSQIDRVVLVGGSSRMPCIHKCLEQKFGSQKLFDSDNPSETVARGAAIWAAYKLDEINHKLIDGEPHPTAEPNTPRYLEKWDEIIIKEKTAHSLGVLLGNGRIDTIINDGQFTPVESTKVYKPQGFNNDNTKAVLTPLIVHQGKDIIGTIPFPEIYTHDRSKKEIPISITFIAESTAVKVKIFVPQGNSDKSDINVEDVIKIS